MLEVCITKFKEDKNTLDYCDSIAQSGLKDIGVRTWLNAHKCKHQFVDSTNKTEFLNYFMQFGVWEMEEINNIPDLNALFIQELSARL